MLYTQFTYQLKEAFNGKLPGESSHRKMMPPERRYVVSPDEKQLVKKSSVLILIFPEGDNLFTCLIKRPANMKHHAGQFAFPGGRVDESDSNEIAAALREANEEIGIEPKNIEVIGCLSNLYVNVSQFDIQPVVAWSDKKPKFKLNKDEVEELILFPLSKYFDSNFISFTELETSVGTKQVPCISLDNKIIWGATAMIMSELSDIIRELDVLKEKYDFS